MNPRRVWYFSAVFTFATVLSACDDPVDAPGDIRGSYWLESIGGEAFPIYLGRETATDASGRTGAVNHWVLGAELYLYNTDYRVVLTTRMRWENVYAFGSLGGDITSTGIGECGAWNYSRPSVFFGNLNRRSPVSLGTGEGVAAGSSITIDGGRLLVFADADLNASPQELRFEKAGSSPPEGSFPCPMNS